MTTPEYTNTFRDTLLPTDIRYPLSADFPFKSTDFPSPRSNKTQLPLPTLTTSSPTTPTNGVTQCQVSTSQGRPNDPSLYLGRIEANVEANVEANDIDLYAIGITGSSGDLLGNCIGVFLVLGVVGGVAVWYIYMIKSLCDISYRDQKDLCPGSNAWLYLLFTISLFLNIYGMLNMCFDASSKKAHLVGNAILLLASTGWGCAELFGVSCIDELYDTLLYVMLAVTVLINLANTAVTIVIIMMM